MIISSQYLCEKALSIYKHTYKLNLTLCKWFVYL